MTVPELNRCAIIRVARSGRVDERAAESYLCARLAEAGYGAVNTDVVAESIADIRETVGRVLSTPPGVLIVLGGTGPGRKDVTPEAIEPLLHKRFDGFSVLFHLYSHQSAGLPGMLSRAFAGTIDDTIVIALPGNLSAVVDAWTHILSHHLSDDLGQCTLRRVVSSART